MHSNKQDRAAVTFDKFKENAAFPNDRFLVCRWPAALWRITLKKDKLREMSLLRKKAHSTMIKKNSKVYKAFPQMEKDAYSDGELKSKIKELNAVGISVVINCESWM